MAVAMPMARFQNFLQSRSFHGSPSSSPSAAEVQKEILSLCQRGYMSSAIQLLSHASSPVPDNICIFLLKSCIKRKALHHVRQVFSHVSSHKINLTGVLGDYLIIAFAKCGGMYDASKAFSAMTNPTLFAWSAMVSGYASSGNGQEAIKMYRLMLDDKFEPDAHVYVSLFKACGTIPDLDMGKALHIEVKNKGFVSNVFVGNSIISMYSKCGSIREAELVFLDMCEHNVVSWNAMLSGYIEQGEAKRVVLLYRQMQEEDGIEPNELSFVMAIQACCLLRDEIPKKGHDGSFCLVIGRALHVDAHRKGFLSHLVVVSALMCMYGKLGDIESVEGVFSHEFEHNVVTWTTLLKGYIHQGKGMKALWMYQTMHKEGVSLDEQAFVLFFQACSILADEEAITIVEGRPIKIMSLEIGRALHKDAKQKGLDSGTFVGGSILHMYGKCGSIDDAEDVFVALPQRDVVSWNVMVSAYVDQGHGDKALHLYKKMLEASIVLDERSIVSTLQACVVCLENNEEHRSMYIEIGQNLHSNACRDGLSSNSFIGNTLINLYGKCQYILDAEHVFGTLSKCNVATWNVMLSTYLELGREDQCLLLYRQMQEEYVVPDERTFVITLQACSGIINNQEESSMSQDIIIALHADARKKEFTSHVFVGNSLMTLYAKIGAIDKAEDVFCALTSRNIVSWNVMLSAYVEQGQAERALLFYIHMHEKGNIPDPQTFASVFQACSMLKEDNASIKHRSNELPLFIGRALHSDAQRKGFVSHLFVGNSILSMYGKFGKLVDATEAFEKLYHRTVVSWNAILSSYVEHGKGNEALILYKRMQEEGVLPNEVTLVCALQASSEAGTQEVCYQIHFIAVSSGLHSSCFVTTTLIHAYGNLANVEDVESVFYQMICPVVESWNAMLMAFSGEGNHVASFWMFQEMLCMGIKPSKVSCFSFLCVCSYTGLVQNGLEGFISMSDEEFGLVPELKHYVIVVDILGRAGDFNKVEKILAKMPLQPDLALWLCLLSACRIHGNIQLGEYAYNQALHLQPDEAALYVSMSNIYADAYGNS